MKTPLRYCIGERSAASPLSEIAASAVLAVPRGEWLRVELASGGCWYGHGFAHRQPYPLNAEPVANAHFAVNNIQSPIWMAQSGAALLAETTQELEVRLNERGAGWLEVRCPLADLTVRVFAGETLPGARAALMRHLGWPPPAPERTLLGDSIFCTWTQYPRAITQERILSMARAIRQHGYPCSVLTIDDRWESAFGELTFSRDFPDPKAMVAELHALGFRVLLWTTPFVNREAATFGELAEKRLLAPRKDKEGSQGGPSLFKWWGGTAGLVDLTNPAGRDWYRAQLLRLKNEIGVDGFKIDGGDAKYQPDPAQTAWHQPAGASGYVDLLLGVFEEIAPGMCESRTAWLSPRRDILWREGGKDTHWGVDNGLKAVVTLGQHLALMGYDALIADMVPGRIQTMVSTLPLPTDELFVRWTEACALLPILQFSYFPWNCAPETAAVLLGLARLHKALEGYLHDVATERETTAAPLLRPLWFDAPHCPELYSVADAFQLGPDLLAAPVLDENQVARDVLLPPGDWLDAWTGRRLGSTAQCQLIAQHPAPCPGIPLFVRAENPALFEAVHAVLRTIPRGSIPSGVTTATYTCGLDRDLSVTG